MVEWASKDWTEHKFESSRLYLDKEIEKVEGRIEKCEDLMQNVSDSQQELLEHVLEVKTTVVAQNGNVKAAVKEALDARKAADVALGKAEDADKRLTSAIIKGLLALLAAGGAGGGVGAVINSFLR